MNQNAPEKFRLAVWFSVKKNLRFLSHRDTIRLWQRTIIRSRLPVRYSQGFNPHMKISLPLPRSVGMAANNELLILELSQPCSQQVLKQKMFGQLPEGIEILAAELTEKNASAQPDWAEYYIELTDQTDKAELSGRIALFERSDHYIVNRPQRGRHPERNIDLRESVTQIELEENLLKCTMKIDSHGSARVDELLTMLELTQPQHVSMITRNKIGYSGMDNTCL